MFIFSGSKYQESSEDISALYYQRWALVGHFFVVSIKVLGMSVVTKLTFFPVSVWCSSGNHQPGGSPSGWSSHVCCRSEKTHWRKHHRSCINHQVWSMAKWMSYKLWYRDKTCTNPTKSTTVLTLRKPHWICCALVDVCFAAGEVARWLQALL